MGKECNKLILNVYSCLDFHGQKMVGSFIIVAELFSLKGIVSNNTNSVSVQEMKVSLSLFFL